MIEPNGSIQTNKTRNRACFNIIKILDKKKMKTGARDSFISWNERDPKYDIGEWSPEHDEMGKGVTLSKEEIVALGDMLDGLEL